MTRIEMRLLEAWFARRTTVAAALCIGAVLVAASLRSVQLGASRAAGAPVFSVSIRYFGVDPEAIERRVTIPLEDAVSSLPGISRLRCVSEYGKSTVEMTLSPSVAPDRFYLSLRDAVNALYPSFPPAVQRPEIRNSSSRDRPFFVAAVTLEGATLDQTRQYVDARLKPAIEQVEGVAEIEVGGGSAREVHLAVDQRRAAAAGLTLPKIASALQEAYLLRPVGLLRSEALEIPVILEGRIGSLPELASLPIPLRRSPIVRLDAIAAARYGSREADTVSRIDGERRITLHIKASGSANLVAVSAAVRARLAGFESQRLSVETVYDLGSQIARSISDVVRSLAYAAGVVSLFVALVLRPLRNAVLLALLLPSVVLLTAAVLSAAAIGIDQNVLAGIAVGVGLVVDPGIVVVSALAAVSPDRSQGGPAAVVGELVSPLAASTATTLIVLAPLFFLGQSTSGLFEVACAIAIMLLTSLALAVLFLPVFAAPARRVPGCRLPPRFPSGSPRRSPAGATFTCLVELLSPRARRRALRRCRRALDRAVAWAASHAGAVLAGGGALCALGAFAATRMELLLAAPADPRSVYAHIELASGTGLEATDRRATELARRIRQVPGVNRVETLARRGSAGMTVALDGTEGAGKRVRSALAARGSELKDAFIYLPEGTDGAGQSIEVSLLGPDDSALRSTADRVARALRSEAWVSQVVLNFKEGPPTYVFAVDHRALANRRLSTVDVAVALRWGIYGPVALKWLESGSREIDLRVRSLEWTSLRAIESSSLPASQGRTVPLAELGRFVLAQPPSHLYRTGRQRAVSFTVHTTLKGAGALVSNLEGFLRRVSLPEGCALRLDREVFERLGRLRTLGLLLTAALGLIFITLAAQMESLSSPLLVMSIVPVSLSVPVTLLWISGAGIDVPIIVSLIIMSGIVVNNSILILDRALARCEGLGSFSSREVQRSIRFAVRRRSRALFLTSATTLLGVLPFLVGGPSGPELFRPLAAVLFYGTLASGFATFLVVPAVAACAPVFARRFPRIRG